MAEIKIQCPMRGVEIVHAIPGRVRLSSLRTTQRIHNFNKNTESLQELSKQLQQQPGIKKIHINPESKSALILFEERILPLQTLLLTLQRMGVEDGRNNPPTLPLSEPLELAKKRPRLSIPTRYSHSLYGRNGVDPTARNNRPAGAAILFNSSRYNQTSFRRV